MAVTADRSSHFAAAIEARVQTPVGVVTDERKLIDTANLGVSRDYNLAIALRCHAVVADGATASSGSRIPKDDQTRAEMEDKESHGTSHFTGRITSEKTILLHRWIRG